MVAAAEIHWFSVVVVVSSGKTSSEFPNHPALAAPSNCPFVVTVSVLK